MSNSLSKIDLYLKKHRDHDAKDIDLLEESELIYENHIFTLYRFGGEVYNSDALIIPSLINGPEILYLNQNFNIIKLLSRKSNVYLVKWKNINEHNKNYDFNSYVNEMSDLVASFRELHLLGHCLGGNIAFGSAYLNQNCISRLTLIGTPWDFSHFKTNFEISFEDYDYIPAIFLEIMFFINDPIEFATRLNRSDNLSRKIETWLHSGNNMSKNSYFQIMQDFVQNNILVKNDWYINSVHIDPLKFYIETLMINGSKDRIVPLASSETLCQILPNAKMSIIDSGHVGYLINSKYQKEIESILFVNNY
jgi:poly(3-hydroxyalkanoate) synthetase